ncbi:MAG: amidohydrolase family protein [bacterium]|nr:amidohydrolase family protein [bacterium]
MLLTIAALCFPLLSAQDPNDADIRAARALFERNIRAIQERDRDAYLACYRASADLVRVGPDGFQRGYDGLASGTPANGSDEWPDGLVARDMQLASIRPGMVYGTYRYRVIFDGVATNGISGRLFLGGEDGWHIALTSAFSAGADAAAAPLALVGATVHTGRGGEPIVDAVIVLRDGKIEAVGPRSEVAVPEGIDVVDVAGRFVIPGLIDTHVHYSQTGWADGRPDASDQRERFPYPETMATNRRHPERFHRAFLRSGITAVFDVGGYPWTRDIGLDTEAAIDAPHVAAAGPLLATFVPEQLRLPDQDQLLLMETEEGVRAMVRSHVQQGSDAIKVWFIARSQEGFEKSKPLVLAAGDEAKKQGIPLIVHATELETARVAVEAGAHLLVHSVEDAPVDDAFLAAAKASGVIYCPTLTVRAGYGMLYMREISDEVRGQLEHVHPSVRDRVLLTEELPADGRFSSDRGRANWQRMMDARWTTMAGNLARVHTAGIPVAMGTDAGNPLTLHGPSVFPELEAMQRAGMTPIDVLTAATHDAARAMGRADDLGLIEAGRVADLVILTADPAARIEHVRSISHVVRAGYLHERGLIVP